MPGPMTIEFQFRDQRFADAFGDKHVRSRPVLEAARPDWTGPEFIKTFDD